MPILENDRYGYVIVKKKAKDENLTFFRQSPKHTSLQRYEEADDYFSDDAGSHEYSELELNMDIEKSQSEEKESFKKSSGDRSTVIFNYPSESKELKSTLHPTDPQAHFD